MAKYTMTLKTLYNNELGKQMINNALSNYPITNNIPNLREEINNRFIKKYYTREIGYETEGLFCFKLNAKMLNIMPKYNMLFDRLVDFQKLNPYENILTIEKTIIDTNKNGTSNNTGNSTLKEEQNNANNYEQSNTQAQQSKEQINDTPQGDLNDIYSVNYASQTQQNSNNITQSGKGNNTETRKNDSTNSIENNNSYNDNEDSTITRNNSGRNIDISDTYLKIRETCIDYIELILNELDSLFMQIW